MLRINLIKLSTAEAVLRQFFGGHRAHLEQDQVIYCGSGIETTELLRDLALLNSIKLSTAEAVLRLDW